MIAGMGQNKSQTQMQQLLSTFCELQHQDHDNNL